MSWQLVSTPVLCEHEREEILAYLAPIFHGEWVYLLRCKDCGRYRRLTHRELTGVRRVVIASRSGTEAG